MLASLHHPNIVRFYGLSSHETTRGTAYYLVTQLQKQTVRDVLKNYEPHAALKAYERRHKLFMDEKPRKFRKPLAPEIIFKMITVRQTTCAQTDDTTTTRCCRCET